MNIKKYLVEFIGTFFLVFTIGCAVASGSVLAPLAIGAGLMALVYSGGHISGAHYNPAVSMAVWLRGKLSTNDMLAYMVVQLVAGIVGGLFSYWITGKPDALAMVPMPMNFGAAVGAEILGTFALCSVVLNVATAPSNAGNSFYGLAIGFMVLAMAVSLGGISGGAFNPAVGLGRTIAEAILNVGKPGLAQAWVYIVGPLVGSAMAAFCYNYLNGRD